MEKLLLLLTKNCSKSHPTSITHGLKWFHLKVLKGLFTIIIEGKFSFILKNIAKKICNLLEVFNELMVETPMTHKTIYPVN